MYFVEKLARILAAIVLIAAFAVPSLAFAHEGHQPLSAAKGAPALSETRAVKKTAAAAANLAALSAARASLPVVATLPGRPCLWRIKRGERDNGLPGRGDDACGVPSAGSRIGRVPSSAVAVAHLH